jgi:hypothetical protein
MIYLASPYSHADEEVRLARFHQVCIVAAELIKQDYVVFCPIAHSHPIEVHGGVGGGWDVWIKQDIPIMERCDELHVACMPGWEESIGVQAEIEWWEKNRFTPVVYHRDLAAMVCPEVL